MSFNQALCRVASDPERRAQLQTRLLEKVEFDTNGGCWLWVGATRTVGLPYGRIGVAGAGGSLPAHRAAYTAFTGTSPRDLCVLHRCDIPFCVNPAHLFLGTLTDNNRDRTQKGRTARPIGHRNPKARLTQSEVQEIRESTDRSADVAAIYGVSAATVRQIRAGSTWGHLGPPKRSRVDRLSQAGELNPFSKLNDAAVAHIRSVAGETKALAELYGVHKTTIQRVRNGLRWIA